MNTRSNTRVTAHKMYTLSTQLPSNDQYTNTYTQKPTVTITKHTMLIKYRYKYRYK